MRQSLSIGLAGSICLFLTGCDTDAIEFATKTREMLGGYQKQLQKQIADAENHYLEYATLRVDSAFTRRAFDLASVRAETGDKLAFAYVERTKRPSRIREELSVYAAKEHAADLEAHQGAVDRSRAYLEKIESLKVEKDKIEAFGKLLDGLAVKRALQKDAVEIGNFVNATKDEFDSLVCKDLEGQIKTLKDKGEGATAAEKANLAVLEDLFAKRKCTKSS